MKYVAILLSLLAGAAPARAGWRTAESTCYAGFGRMANGHYTHWGAVAMNRHRLGTRIRLRHPFYRRRGFRVEDRIGWGSQLDFWRPATYDCIRWGRRT